MSAIHDWVAAGHLQPEPITAEIWPDLPGEFRWQVEVVSGQAVRCDPPNRQHQSAVRRITSLLEAAARDYAGAHPSVWLDVSPHREVTLWEGAAATIRRPDIILHLCEPQDARPLPASLIRVVVEVVSPGSEKTDWTDKMAEYAAARIPFYWLVPVAGNSVAAIDIYVLDFTVGSYRHFRTLSPEDEVSVVEVPVRIKVPWSELTTLVL